jgi:hypothetical protein
MARGWRGTGGVSGAGSADTGSDDLASARRSELFFAAAFAVQKRTFAVEAKVRRMGIHGPSEWGRHTRLTLCCGDERRCVFVGKQVGLEWG